MADISSETLAAGRGEQNGKVETSHHPKTDPERKEPGYYGIPPIKRAHWTWQIPLYFWLGGITAGVALFSAVSKLVGKEDPAVTRLGRYFSVIYMILSPILLIWDLGRPERFLNMMRIWKLRSPMSNQSWSLVAYGNVSGILMLKQAAEDGLMGQGSLRKLVISLVPDRVLQILSLPGLGIEGVAEALLQGPQERRADRIVVAVADAVPRVSPPEVLYGRHDAVQMVEAPHADSDHLHQLEMLRLHGLLVRREERPHFRVELEQPRVK